MKERASPTRDAVLAVLAEGPMLRSELEERTGKKLQSTITEMKKQRLIHVHSWVRGTGNMRAVRMVYAVGDGVDAPHPGPSKEKFRRYYEKHKAKIAEKRRLNGYKYSAKSAAAQRRRRAKKKLETNPFLQLNWEMFNGLRKRASRPKREKVSRQPSRAAATPLRVGAGSG